MIGVLAAGRALTLEGFPDYGPKGMARLDFYYLSSFASGLFCSSTLTSLSYVTPF